METLKKRQWPFGGLLLIVSITHWFPLNIWLLELLTAFAHVTAVGAAFVAIISLLCRFNVLTILSFISLLISGSLVLPFAKPDLSTEVPANFAVGQFNLYHHNNEADEAILAILQSGADILSVQELNSQWENEFSNLLDKDYPYSVIESWDSCCYGIGLFSRFPIVSHLLSYSHGIPIIEAKIDVNGCMISIISCHTQAPAFPDRTEVRNAQMNKVAEMVAQIKTRYIVLGDFNIVPWDGFFKRFQENTKLHVARGGFQATFPMNLGFAMIPIDHIMYSQQLSPTLCKTVFLPGSDHKGIVADFYIE